MFRTPDTQTLPAQPEQLAPGRPNGVDAGSRLEHHLHGSDAVVLHQRRLPGKLRRSITSSSVPPGSPSSTVGTTAAARPGSRGAQLCVGKRDRTDLVDRVLDQAAAVRDLLDGTPYAGVNVEAALALGNVRRAGRSRPGWPLPDHLGRRPDRGGSLPPVPALGRRGGCARVLPRRRALRRSRSPLRAPPAPCCAEPSRGRPCSSVLGHPASGGDQPNTPEVRAPGGTDVRRTPCSDRRKTYVADSPSGSRSRGSCDERHSETGHSNGNARLRPAGMAGSRPTATVGSRPCRAGQAR